VGVFKNLLEKAVGLGSANSHGFAALLPRVEELEENMRQLEVVLEQKFQVSTEQ